MLKVKDEFKVFLEGNASAVGKVCGPFTQGTVEGILSGQGEWTGSVIYNGSTKDNKN